jgi:1-aminocyclopropane-1-carboxylate deaminase
MIELLHLFSSLPREKFFYYHPSSIDPLARLSSELNGSNHGQTATKFWIKREDSNSGLALGGNKISKLEYVLPDALKAEAAVPVTAGGLQSNHKRQVAAAAAKYGLKMNV